MNQGYDQGGAYWGIGDPIWCTYGNDEVGKVRIYCRARTKLEAVQKFFSYINSGIAGKCTIAGYRWRGAFPGDTEIIHIATEKVQTMLCNGRIKFLDSEIKKQSAPRVHNNSRLFTK